MVAAILKRLDQIYKIRPDYVPTSILNFVVRDICNQWLAFSNLSIDFRYKQSVNSSFLYYI